MWVWKEPIGHNPYELASYLSAKYHVYTREQVQDELREIFEAQYELTLTEEVEVRYRTETRTDSEGKLCVFDRRMIQASVVIHPAVKILLRPFQTVPIAAPVVIPLALFPFGKLPGHKGVRRARIMPQRKAVSAVKGGGFQNGIALYSFQMVPPFCASGQHGPKLCMLRNAGKNRGGMDCSIPAPETPSKKPQISSLSGRQIVTAARPFLPHFSHAFPAFPAVPLGLAGIGTVGLPPLGQK